MLKTPTSERPYGVMFNQGKIASRELTQPHRPCIARYSIKQASARCCAGTESHGSCPFRDTPSNADKCSSCEPCRISKIKCDHSTPTCGKCETRGITEQVTCHNASDLASTNDSKCFYHPNPMTKPAGTPRKKPGPRQRKANARCVDGRLASLTLSPPILRNEVNPVPLSGTWPSPPDSASRTTQADADPVRSFYLGSTSYASVFSEDRPLPDTVHQQPSERLRVTPSLSSRSMGTRHCQMGVGHSVVSKLAPFSFFEKSLKMYFEWHTSTALVGPLVMSLLPQLREDVRQLMDPGHDAYLMYAEMTKNTMKPLKVPSTMLPSGFHTLLTGQSLRWETLGLIMIVAASNAQFTSPDDPLFTLENGKQLAKDEFVEDMIQATNDCIMMCQVHGAVNDVMVWLVYSSK
jgi:hypothetical protein